MARCFIIVNVTNRGKHPLLPPQDSLAWQNLVLDNVWIISYKKVFVCSWALAVSAIRAVALLQTLIITIQPDIILLKMY